MYCSPWIKYRYSTLAANVTEVLSQNELFLPSISLISVRYPVRHSVRQHERLPENNGVRDIEHHEMGIIFPPRLPMFKCYDIKACGNAGIVN